MAKPTVSPTRNLFKVNLLIFKGDQPKLLPKLIKWLLSSGRFIVVFVELIVIGAFVYRYKLDADLAALQEKIKEQIPYVQSLKNDEFLIRQTQFQLNTIKQIKSESPDFTKIILKVATLTPKSIKLSNITLDRTQSFPKTNISISGQTPSNLELSAFVKALQKDPTFSSVTLTNVSLEGQTSFTVTGSVAAAGGSSS